MSGSGELSFSFKPWLLRRQSFGKMLIFIIVVFFTTRGPDELVGDRKPQHCECTQKNGEKGSSSPRDGVMHKSFVGKVGQVDGEGEDGHRKYRWLLEEDTAVEEQDGVEDRPESKSALHLRTARKAVGSLQLGEDSLLHKPLFPKATEARAQIC